MPAPYSYDLRQKVINAIELDGIPKTEASQVFHVSRNTINLWLQRKEHTGDFLPKPNRPPGHSHQITDWQKFQAFAQEHGHKTSAQMAQLWDDDISPRTISRALKKIGFTRKKTYGYQERDEQQREEFIAQIQHMEPEGLVYLDEAGMNSQDSDYPYGYCEEGQRFGALKSGKRQGRVSYMAAWCHQQLLAPFTFEGCCNRTVFELWLEFILIPTLKPGQTLVGVEREVAFPNSHSKPCLILSHHTAPDVDTLFVIRNRVTNPCFCDFNFRKLYTTRSL
ncbi:hypothetical protein AmaxDRAFT_3372 [Limnospira maxima CS-328]|uniref:Transposase n=6 Tax=Sirenicapillariaceae TaxID=2934961 RepID=A0A9P1NXY0_9CYAN|nr:hypothetical protein AmaxDRAFT_3372 [Limnospira maxima CS-328]UWU49489.1 Transposase [Arthrospira platensis C1]CDM94426.1 conserved protein of unknown function [Limnospira indica PCC 8005]